jgi:hypothetical protein
MDIHYYFSNIYKGKSFMNSYYLVIAGILNLALKKLPSRKITCKGKNNFKAF